jgi:hypothetical protein
MRRGGGLYLELVELFPMDVVGEGEDAVQSPCQRAEVFGVLDRHSVSHIMMTRPINDELKSQFVCGNDVLADTSVWVQQPYLEGNCLLELSRLTD